MFETDSGCYLIALKKRHATASELHGIVGLEDSIHGHLFPPHSLLRIPRKIYSIQELWCSSNLVILISFSSVLFSQTQFNVLFSSVTQNRDE